MISLASNNFAYLLYIMFRNTICCEMANCMFITSHADNVSGLSVFSGFQVYG